MWCSQWNQIYSLGPSQSVRMGQVACLTNMPRAGGECDAECQDARELKKKKKFLETQLWYTACKPVWEKTTHGAILIHGQ